MPVACSVYLQIVQALALVELLQMAKCRQKEHLKRKKWVGHSRIMSIRYDVDTACVH